MTIYEELRKPSDRCMVLKTIRDAYLRGENKRLVFDGAKGYGRFGQIALTEDKVIFNVYGEYDSELDKTEMFHTYDMDYVCSVVKDRLYYICVTTGEFGPVYEVTLARIDGNKLVLGIEQNGMIGRSVNADTNKNKKGRDYAKNEAGAGAWFNYEG